MNNKLGFTEEQQRELEALISIACHAGRLTTETTIGTNEAIAKEAMALVQFMRESYPKGPKGLRRSLENIARFCDLASIIYEVNDGEL